MSFKIDEWIIQFDKESRPKTIVVEPSIECNFSCQHCFRNTFYETVREKFLELDTFNKILKDSKNIINRIVFTGFGEPTLNPYFHEILETALKNFNNIVLNTNGSRLIEFFDIILRYTEKIELVLSIHNESILNIIEELMEKIKSKGSKIYTKAIVTVSRTDYRKLPNIVDKCLRYFSTIVITNIVPVDYRSLDDTCIDDYKCETYIKDMLARYGFRFMFSGTYVKSIDFKLRTSIFECPYIESKAVFIRSDGLVTPCMFMSHGWKCYLQGIERTIVPVIYGNVIEKNIISIWHDPTYYKFRFLVRMRQFPCCLDCELVQYCTFTTSNEHDCWGNSPSCAFCPFARKLAFCPV